MYSLNIVCTFVSTKLKLYNMSSNKTGLQDPFSNFSAGSVYSQQGGWNGINTTPQQKIPTYTTEHIFYILDSMFKLSLEQKQIQLLQDLYNSNDEANRTMATSMFHAMLLKKEEDK